MGIIADSNEILKRGNIEERESPGHTHKNSIKFHILRSGKFLKR